MNLWNDGRSGTAGCLAGNLVLAHIRDTAKEEFHERKGTTFRGRGSIWVGRMCSTDSYLFGRDRHWANLSLEQHREVNHEASLEGAAVKYLFVTALAGEPVIHYWTIPSEVIQRVAFSDPRLAAEYIYSLHIRADDQGRFFLEGEDVSKYHQVLNLTSAASSRLERAFDADRAFRQRRQVRRRPARTATNDSASPQIIDGAANEPRGHFEIPLKGGRCAVLQVPLPAAEVDLARIKGWIDLMNDVLTEPRSQNDTEARRMTALESVKQLHAASAAAGKDRMTASQIDDEIRRARGDR